jgi:hypothetical protein
MGVVENQRIQLDVMAGDAVLESASLPLAGSARTISPNHRCEASAIQALLREKGNTKLKLPRLRRVPGN